MFLLPTGWSGVVFVRVNCHHSAHWLLNCWSSLEQFSGYAVHLLSKIICPTPESSYLDKLVLVLVLLPMSSCVLLLISTWGKNRHVADLFKEVISYTSSSYKYRSLKIKPDTDDDKGIEQNIELWFLTQCWFSMLPQPPFLWALVLIYGPLCMSMSAFRPAWVLKLPSK